MSVRALFSKVAAAGLAAMALFGAAAAQTTTCQGRPVTILDFRNPVLQSGTALSVGAVYRFSNVATGVDALVRIDAITNATLTIIDRDTGLIPNFQPELGGSNARSVDFTISLVTAGGLTPVSADFAASGIDIDGDSGSLREYAEFSMPMASYVLETPTNLDVNATGPSVPTNIRFESRTSFTAPGIDPTATANIVSIQYTSTSSFKYRIGTLGTGSTNRLTSLDFSCPVLNFPIPNPQTPQDFGDAPSAYGNPAHDIVAGVRLGATITAETTGYNSPTASGDSGDDGITLPTFTQTQTATISASVAGAGGRLQGWIDWNGDGDFADAGEQVATNIQDNGVGDTNPASGAISFVVTAPGTATTALTFARFRWGTQSSLTSTAIASNGEVEDYAVSINPASPTLAASKTVAIYNPTGTTPFATPGNDVVYSLTVQNSGSGAVGSNTLFIVDTLPAQVTFYNGDMDGAGPATGAVYFTQSGAGLTFTLATDLKYSNSATRPTTFAACAYTPAAGYDAGVKHVCLNPKGSMLAGTPNPSFTAQFRVQIK